MGKGRKAAILAAIAVVAVLIGLWIFADGKIREKNEKAFAQELIEQATDVCILEAQKLMEDKLYTVHSVDFDIRKLEQVTGSIYIVYVDWYVETDVYASPKADREYWMTMVSGTMPRDVYVQGQRISLGYMDDNYNEGCNLYYNDATVFNGNDYFNENVGTDDAGEIGSSAAVYCPGCGKQYRGSSTYGRRIQAGMTCGRGKCKK